MASGTGAGDHRCGPFPGSGRRVLSRAVTVLSALAMAILATHPPTALVDIVANQDVAAMTLVSGVGKKTAERLLVELKSKLSVPVLDGVGGGGGGSSVVADVREALIGLGYADAEIRDTLRELPPSGDAAELLRDALKALGARRA